MRALLSLALVPETTCGDARRQVPTVCLLRRAIDVRPAPASAGLFFSLKVVPAERVCVDAATFEAVSMIAAKVMADATVARKLMREEE